MTIYPKTEGNYLTQVNLDNENSRVFAKALSGSGIKEEDWRDATPQEKADWEEAHKPDPHKGEREEAINREIRRRYTDNDEFMILRQYSAHPDNPAFKTAFEEYNAFVEEILAKYPEQ